jgi:hypothetical protein
MDRLTFARLCLKETTETTVSPPLTSSVTPINPYNLLLLILDQIIDNMLITILPLVLPSECHIPRKHHEQTLVMRSLPSGTWNYRDLMNSPLFTHDKLNFILKQVHLPSINQRRGSAPQLLVDIADGERYTLSQHSLL